MLLLETLLETLRERSIVLLMTFARTICDLFARARDFWPGGRKLWTPPRIHFHVVKFGAFYDAPMGRAIAQTRVVRKAQSKGDLIEVICPEDTASVTDSAGNVYEQMGSAWYAREVKAFLASRNRVIITRALPKPPTPLTVPVPRWVSPPVADNYSEFDDLHDELSDVLAKVLT